jgi:anhydro-N-acetylmuramic acid kinase
MTSRFVIGLSSGTSLDGVDAVLVEAQGTGLDIRLRLVHFVHQDYPRDLRELIAKTSATSVTGKQAALVHRFLGEAFATTARLVADQARVGLTKIQCLGSAGHTVWHEAEARTPTMLGLGMAAVIAERTGVTTVSDFRSRDLAAGGQGYPLTPLIDHLLFHKPGENRVLVHLGGLANVVFLPADGQLRHVLGFQAAPCNLLLDACIRLVTHGRETFDAGGKHAVQGCCIEPLLARWLEHPLLQRRPPKMISRQAFGEEFVRQAVQQAQHMKASLHDVLCTATHFVARGISHAVHTFLPQPTRILLSGGGVQNGFLWHLLSQQLPPVLLERTDVHGIPTAARKAVAFAGLAALTLDGVPGNLSSATGATGTRVLGSLTPGSSTNWARCLTWMAAQTATPVLAAA